MLIGLLVLIGGCTGKYFRAADKALPQSFDFDLSNLPYSEYWTGIVFNGAKIGFSHFTISPSASLAGRSDIRSDAALRIRFLMFDKHIKI
jgi:hypothetical protein